MNIYTILKTDTEKQNPPSDSVSGSNCSAVRKRVIKAYLVRANNSQMRAHLPISNLH